MNPRLMRAVAVLCVAGLAGCLEQTTVVTVNKTGAGTVVVTSTMTKVAAEMMQQLGSQAGGKGKKEAGKKNPLLEDQAKYKANAAAMGEGVKFVGVKELTRPDGSVGTEETYSFADVTKLKLNSDVKVSSPGGGAAPAKAEKKDPTTFAFAKGTPAKLTIKQPEPKPGAEKADKPADPQGPAQDEAALAQMKQMFDGFRFRTVVKVDGEIAKTNATYVDVEDGKKKAVTLLDMNVGELLKDDAQFKKLTAMGKMDDIATAKEKLKGLPGIKVELERQVEVEFK